VQAAEDKLVASVQENSRLQVQLEELKTKHTNDLNAEMKKIQEQFETMTKNFENQTSELERQLRGKEMEVAEKENAVEVEQKKVAAAEEKILELEANSGEAREELSGTQTELEKARQKHISVQEAIERVEGEKCDVEEQLKNVKASMVTQEKHESVKVLLTSTLEEVDQLKLENTKTKSLEKEVENLKKAKSKAETFAQHSQKKQASLQTSEGRLQKQLGEVKEVVVRYEEETGKAATSPWESEDWEGLSSSEKWDMMHQDLVPLQQARLLKLCQKELEADLSSSKSDFLRAVADLSSVKEEKTRLEARICILESRDKHQGKDQKRDGKEKEELNVAEPSRPVVAPAKFTAPEPLKGKASSKGNLRRSSRSASAVASVLLSTMEEMKVEQEKREKLVIGRHLMENKEEQRAKEQPTKEEMPSVKEKSTKEEKEKAGKRLITPEKGKAEKKQKASAAGNLPREALAPLTNSPRKPVAPSALLAKTSAPVANPTSDPPPSIRGLRSRETRRTRNAEECKQQ